MTFTLSPYGEGYCPVCRFVEPLGPDGLIEPHTRFSYSFPGGREICAGSCRRPPKRTPYAAGKNRFRLKPPERRCPVCRKLVKMTTSHTGNEYFTNHRNRMLTQCRMVGLAYDPADNG